MSTDIDSYEKPRVIDEVALPAGLFPGQSKLTFDTLHHAITTEAGENQRIQLTKRQLLRMSGLKTLNTLNLHLKYFRHLRLITISPGAPGDPRGNFYSIHPERIPAAIAHLQGQRPKLGHIHQQVKPVNIIAHRPPRAPAPPQESRTGVRTV